MKQQKILNIEGTLREDTNKTYNYISVLTDKFLDCNRRWKILVLMS
jgi:hypothetical protein